MPGRNTYWDDKVQELCKKDGGTTVFEKVELSQAEYEKLGGSHGTIPIPDERFAANRPYFSRPHVKEISPSEPRVFRLESDIVRRIDGKVLGRLVSYSRVGGDLPTGVGHSTSSSCFDIPGIAMDLSRKVFLVTGGSR